MNNDILEGRKLRKNKRNLIRNSYSTVKRLEGFSGGIPSQITSQNAEDITAMEDNSDALNQSIRKMNRVNKTVTGVVSNLEEIQEYGNKMLRGDSAETPSYVTNAGIMKRFVDGPGQPYRQSYNDTISKNGCPGYAGDSHGGLLDTQGTMATGYDLFPVGSDMVTGQSCGHEGEMVQVATFDDNVSSLSNIAKNLGKLGYIDPDATMRPINRDDYTMLDKFHTHTSSVQGANMGSCNPGWTPIESLGCWKDTGNRAMWIGGIPKGSGMSTVSSVEECGAYCKKYGSSIYAVQDGKQCFCAVGGEPGSGQGFKTYGSSTNCTKPCTGNSEETCGGSWANQVYKTATAPAACDIDALENTCIANDSCTGFVVNASDKTYQMFDTELKGSDLTTTSADNNTFYTQRANFVSSDETCKPLSVNRGDVKAHQFANYPVSSALDPAGTGQCGLGQYLQPDFDIQNAAIADVDTQASKLAATNVGLANTLDNIYSQSAAENKKFLQQLKINEQEIQKEDNAIVNLENPVWKQESDDMDIRKRQNMFHRTILWGGLAVAVLGVAVTTGRKGTK